MKTQIQRKCILTTIILLTIFLTTIAARNYPNKSENGQNYRNGNTITYEWTHTTNNGKEYYFKFHLNLGWNWQYMQDRYTKLDHRHGFYKRFIDQDPFYRVLVVTANRLRKIAYNNYLNECALALSFVQSLPYQGNMETYQRYSSETLIDGRGDCSDTSVLFAGILKVWNYDCLFLNFPNHLAVGVWSRDDGGCYWINRGRKYYYCETTGSGWQIGACVDDVGTSAKYEYVY